MTVSGSEAQITEMPSLKIEMILVDMTKVVFIHELTLSDAVKYLLWHLVEIGLQTGISL